VNSSLKIVLVVIAVLVALVLLRTQPWNQKKTVTAGPETHIGPNTGTDTKQTLTVAYLPVTCHLTCPVTDFASKTTDTGTRFDSKKFTEFPPIADAMKTGDLQATFMILPMAIRLRDQGVPVKICYLGHRDGTEVMVRKDDPARSLRDLKGKTMAIPSPFSNQNLSIHRLMEKEGMQPDDIKFVPMAPPDMPTALASKAIDAYIVGEPFAAKAEMDGTGRVLYYAKDIWPHFVSCALVVREDLIKNKPDVVKDLVRGIAQSGEWAETHRAEAAKLVAPYNKQKEALLKFVLTQPADRVSYRMLTPTDDDINQIQEQMVKMNYLKKPLPISEILDRSFIPTDIKPANIDEAKVGTMPS
jgi:NitT/TauT family transport system substrate-binding protein